MSLFYLTPEPPAATTPGEYDSTADEGLLRRVTETKSAPTSSNRIWCTMVWRILQT